MPNVQQDWVHNDVTWGIGGVVTTDCPSIVDPDVLVAGTVQAGRHHSIGHFSQHRFVDILCESVPSVTASDDDETPQAHKRGHNLPMEQKARERDREIEIEIDR